MKSVGEKFCGQGGYAHKVSAVNRWQRVATNNEYSGDDACPTIFRHARDSNRIGDRSLDDCSLRHRLDLESLFIAAA
jgi:hypothetical protein